MRCPQGHDSAATDYCDTCGSPMHAAAPASPPPPAPTPAAPTPPAATAAEGSGSGPVAASGGTAPQLCPNCGATSSADALFCEACGYDFTTGVMPRPVPLTDGSYVGGVGGSAAESVASALEPGGSGAGPGGSSAGPDGSAAGPDGSGGSAAGPDGSGGSGAGPDESGGSAAGPGGSAAGSGEGPGGSAAAAAPTPGPASTPAPAAPPGGTASKRAVNRPPSRTTIKDWVVEIWIDPDWYAVQESSEPCPSPGVPDVVTLHDGALVGRPSASRSSRPDIDCGADTGVSRRQALLSTDGRRWWIEDLGSSNGTYVGPASGPLPADAIAAKVEVDSDDRIYVGAWTRLVVRPATDSERAGQG